MTRAEVCTVYLSSSVLFSAVTGWIDMCLGRDAWITMLLAKTKLP